MVAGALANRPDNGGGAWVRLSWVLGLRDLGVDVRFVEQISPQACLDAAGQPVGPGASVNAAFFRQVTQDFGLADISTLLVEGEAVAGPTLDDLTSFADGAAVVNLSGHLTVAPVLAAARSRIYVDTDPGFTQLWHSHGQLGTALDDHDQHFTVGEHVGTPACTLPTGGIRWRPVRQPVVLAHWPVCPPPADPDRFTTVSTWRPPFGSVEHDGRVYGLKVHEFRRVLALPSVAAQRFELALDIHPADDRDRAALLDHGWHLVDPREVAGGPDAFRRYVQGSGAEFSVAQGVYVDTGSGWFSDRTVRYLASGRPALVQETGFSRSLPTGTGLVAFSTLQEAVDGATAIARDPERHAAAAREIAERHFAAPRVLGRFADEAGIG